MFPSFASVRQIQLSKLFALGFGDAETGADESVHAVEIACGGFVQRVKIRALRQKQVVERFFDLRRQPAELFAQKHGQRRALLFEAVVRAQVIGQDRVPIDAEDLQKQDRRKPRAVLAGRAVPQHRFLRRRQQQAQKARVLSARGLLRDKRAVYLRHIVACGLRVAGGAFERLLLGDLVARDADLLRIVDRQFDERRAEGRIGLLGTLLPAS